MEVYHSNNTCVCHQLSTDAAILDGMGQDTVLSLLTNLLRSRFQQ
jgi:hypothetical protein